MVSERVRTATAAKILGTDPAYIVHKMKNGELPIGEYEKKGKHASVKIYIGKLARYLEIERDVLVSKIIAIEGEGKDAETCT